MAEKRQSLDVWIVESNTVYREVPYSVVTDWVQQGRLLGEDYVRPIGSAQWYRVGTIPAFQPFFPQPARMEIDDQAEALQPVELDFAWKRPADDEDEDVDMIPLIDVSLVLLVFFMMASTVGVASGLIETPQAKYKLLTMNTDLVWVGIAPGENGPAYSLGEGQETAGKEFRDRQSLLEALEARLRSKNGARVAIRAHRQLPYDVVRAMTIELETLKRRGLVLEILAEVSEKEGS
ncbi:MAG: hypothetical protein KatS3mg105_1132 [Gemmatales bacterium]|nr:MAG: hypothetical protein KatS3mg105_1132 [Gemmatales bacterium]